MVVWNISSRVATVALLGLLVLDVTLVGTALRSTHISGIDTSPVSPASTSSAPTAQDSTDSAVTSSPTTSRPADVSLNAPLKTMLVAVDNQRAWRVGAGSCSAGGATLATTADGGKTWAKGTSNLRQIVRVRPADGRSAFVIGANSNCAPVLRDTSDGGGTWISGGVAAAWFRDPKNPAVVRAPGSARWQPCGKREVLDLAVLSAGSARVLCADGLVRSTTNNGTLWKTLGTVEGAVTLAVSTSVPAETYVARLGAPDCAGVQILRVRQNVATSCVRTAIPKAPGQIAISLIKGGGWLAVGDITMRSTDDLVTWRVSS